MADPTAGPMRIAFIGTVDFSWHCLDQMLSVGANVVLAAYVDPACRGPISDYRPLDDLCRRHAVPALTFRRIADPEPMAAVREARPEVVFVMGLSQLLPPALLDLPPGGCVGTHPALLPANRGRAVIPWSILLHHERGGLTLFYLTPEVDAGDIIAQATWPISRDDTATTIYYEKMIPAGRRLIREYLPAITRGTAPRLPQDHAKATYLPRRTPADGLIDWSRSAEEICDLVRATARPYPGAFTYLRDLKVIIWKAGLDETAAAVPAGRQGAPGEVLTVRDGAALVAAGSGAVWLEVIEAKEGPHPAASILQAGLRFGIAGTG